jgi:hypothetical protein
VYFLRAKAGCLIARNYSNQAGSVVDCSEKNDYLRHTIRVRRRPGVLARTLHRARSDQRGVQGADRQYLARSEPWPPVQHDTTMDLKTNWRSCNARFTGGFDVDIHPRVTSSNRQAVGTRYRGARRPRSVVPGNGHHRAHRDTDNTTVLHMLSIGVVAAGDVVYSGVHLYLVEAANGGLQAWMTALASSPTSSRVMSCQATRTGPWKTI